MKAETTKRKGPLGLRMPDELLHMVKRQAKKNKITVHEELISTLKVYYFNLYRKP